MPDSNVHDGDSRFISTSRTIGPWGPIRSTPDRYINPDLTVYLHRLPEGDRVCMDAVTYAEPHGIGLAASVIYDATGSIGRSLQSLYIAPLR